MEKTYQIEVCMTPAYRDHAAKPYHWVIYSYEKEWQNECAGWAKSGEEAWTEAHDFFQNYLRQ